MGFPDSADTPIRLTLGPNVRARPSCAGTSGVIRRLETAFTAMKKNLVPLLGIAVVVAILSTAIFYGLVAGKLGEPAGGGSSVVIAGRNIAKGATLAEADLKVVQWSGAPPDGAHSTIQQLAGLTTLEPIAANEAITSSRVASAHSGAGAGLGIPKGMRAISVMVSDSTGLLGILQRGHKVDVQAVHQRIQSAEVDVRTILANVEILRVDPKPEPTPGRSNLPVVTLLIQPADADRLAAVDSGAKVRLTLRNPLDADASPVAPATLSSVMSGRASNSVRASATGRSPVRSGAAGSSDPPIPVRSQGQVQFLIRIAGAGEEAISKLDPALVRQLSGDVPQVAVLPPGASWESVFGAMEKGNSLHVVSSSRLTAANEHAVQLDSGRHSGYALRMTLRPTLNQQGGLKLRLSPELAWPKGQGTASRRVESEVELVSGQSIVVGGLTEQSEVPALFERLFSHKAHASGGRRLVVVVTPAVTEPLRTAAIR